MDFKIMSFNLLCGNVTPERTARVITAIKTAAPDILGVQEATPLWMQLLRNELGNYTAAGFGREGGDKGEYSAIFVKNERFVILNEGTRWLTDTPEEFSFVEGSLCPRVYTFGKLQDKQTGKIVYHVNTHLDHGPEEVRMIQAKYLYTFLESLDSPVTVTGDFNFEETTSNVYRYLTSGMLADTKYLAKDAYKAPTFHGYKGLDAVIDYCFCERGAYDVADYRILDTPIDGKFPSDHHPVLVTLSLADDNC